MFQIDRPISLANAKKIKNFHRSVHGGYYIVLSCDVIRDVFVLFHISGS